MQNKGWVLQAGESLRILCAADSEAVGIAAHNLAVDIMKVCGAKAVVELSEAKAAVESGKTKAVVELCGAKSEVKACMPQTDEEKSGNDVDDTDEAKEGGGYSIVIGEEALGHKEAYAHRVKDGVLYISGADRRGMIYGIYELSRMMGVSPWYFFADVPVKHKDSISLPEGYYFSDYPSVEYRGIFINDEEELEKWVQLHMGEETIGVRTYEKIFELLLRLRANYIWPAMHVNSFNLKRENGELADRMGIVVGTSHCDMLMRSNNREWYPWLQKKGYRDVEYDYSIPGRNREVLNEYWKESVEQNKDFEVGYTLGMRGIHDSGFETRSLAGLSGSELKQAKIDLLQTVINAQEKILEDTLDKEPLKSFVPYKEVLELYDNGLEVPEDLTLIWTNDNYGYIRRCPGEKEKKRRGGNGIYYHNSYWAPPGASYLFINSIPLAHTRNELYKAWCEGIRKVWVMNVGAIKPLEQEITFYLNFAWEVGKKNTVTEDVDKFLAQWINETFSGGHGEKMAEILNDFSQLTNVRKIELMDSDVFSQTAYGDEAMVRINRYRELVRQADDIYEALPEEEKDAFFHICLMKIHAAYYTNCMYYYADRSNLCTKQGKNQAAHVYTKLCHGYDDRRRQMLEYYNNVMAGGKWSGILTPEDFPPPRTAMLPACVVPLVPIDEVENKLIVTLWNDEKDIIFNKDSVKWIELGCAGEGELEYEITVPEWIIIDAEQVVQEQSAEGAKTAKTANTVNTVNTAYTAKAGADRGNIIGNSLGKTFFGKVGAESRIMLKVDAEAVDYSIPVMEGQISLQCKESGQSWDFRAAVNTQAFKVGTDSGCAVEDGGIVTIEAVDAVEFAGYRTGNFREEAAKYPEHKPEAGSIECRKWKPEETVYTGWNIIRRLGRDHGAVVEACGSEGKGLTYVILLTKAVKEPMLELHRFPSLDSTGRIRAELSVDGGERFIVESMSNDEWRGTWKTNILNNVDKLTAALPPLAAGFHEIKVYSVDKYFAYSRIAVYTDERKENMLGGAEGDCRLSCGYGCEASGSPVGDKLYANIPLLRRPMLVAEPMPGDNTLPDTNIRIMQDLPEGCVHTTTPEKILAKASEFFAEENGTIRIDMAAALAQTENAYTEGQWDYCVSESYDRTGLAMIIRRPGIVYDDELPSLHYRIYCKGGRYNLWILTKNESYDLAELSASVDGRVLSKEEINHGFRIGRYCGERVYRWINLWQQELSEGIHEIAVYTKASGNRFDRIYMTTGDELPPTDVQWGKA